jgi:hypothetical protein
MNRWISETFSPIAVAGIAFPWFCTVLLLAALLSTAGCSGGSGTPAPVTGTVGVPLADARIYIYREGDDIYGPAQIISDPTSIEGSFSLSLRPGKYLAVVRKRVSEEVAGPVMIGDYRGEPVPFEVAEGAQGVSLSLTATLKVANEKAFPPRMTGDATGISGAVQDADGREVALLEGHRRRVRSAEFTPDGKRLLTQAADGTARLWILDDDALLAAARERACRDFTTQERETYGDLLGD